MISKNVDLVTVQQGKKPHPLTLPQLLCGLSM